MKQAQLNKVRAQWHKKYDDVSKSSKKYVKFGEFKAKYEKRQAYDKARYEKVKSEFETYKSEHETKMNINEFKKYQTQYKKNKEAYRQEQMNYRLSLNQKVDAIYEMWGDENGIDVNDSPRGSREKEIKDEVLYYIEKVVSEHPDMPEEQIFSLYVSGKYRING